MKSILLIYKSIWLSQFHKLEIICKKVIISIHPYKSPSKYMVWTGMSRNCVSTSQGTKTLPGWHKQGHSTIWLVQRRTVRHKDTAWVTQTRTQHNLVGARQDSRTQRHCQMRLFDRNSTDLHFDSVHWHKNTKGIVGGQTAQLRHHSPTGRKASGHPRQVCI